MAHSALKRKLSKLNHIHSNFNAILQSYAHRFIRFVLERFILFFYSSVKHTEMPWSKNLQINLQIKYALPCLKGRGDRVQVKRPKWKRIGLWDWVNISTTIKIKAFVLVIYYTPKILSAEEEQTHFSQYISPTWPVFMYLNWAIWLQSFSNSAWWIWNRLLLCISTNSLSV